MKVKKAAHPEEAEQPGGSGDAPTDLALPSAKGGATLSASSFGIPEAEFTPHVMAAIAPLVQRNEQLQQELAQAQTRLEEIARTADQDMLLPVLNRRALAREISRFVAFAERYGTPSSLLYFDLDKFKTVNDEFGHAAGDSVLRHFSDLIAGQIRDSDVLGRIGGDEFGVILAHVTLDQAMRKGASLEQSLLDRPPIVNGKAVRLSFSYGAYELHAGGSAEVAFAEADRAMYEQKRAGAKNLRP